MLHNEYLDEDDLGPKIDCISCKGYFYIFQYNDHLLECLKKNPEYARNSSEQKSEKDQEKGKYSQPINEEKEEEKELQKFVNKVSHISHIIDKKSNLKDKKHKVEQFDVLTELPCPFCARMLQLENLQHIDTCQSSTNCIYCKDKYPKLLYGSHLKVCSKKDSFFGAKQHQFNISRLHQPPMKFGSNPPKKEPQQKRHVRSKIFEQKGKKKDEKKNGSQLNNPSYYDMQSRVRKRQLEGLSSSRLLGLNHELFMPVENDELQECIICSNQFKAGQHVITLACHHLFHSDCLEPWLEQRSRCPTCKAKI